MLIFLSNLIESIIRQSANSYMCNLFWQVRREPFETVLKINADTSYVEMHSVLQGYCTH